MYSVASYGSMITDEVRMAVYTAALQQAIKPDSIVLDIGTGTGIWTLLACQYGAQHVYAIEPDSAIQVAQDIARENGFADRITFIQDMSTRIELPTQIDVLVSDLHGVLPLYQYYIPTIVDARKRFLVPNGCIIPNQELLWAALANSPDDYKHFDEPWRENAYGLNMNAARQITINTWRRAKLKPEQLISEPQLWATLDYYTIEEPDVKGTLTWVVDQTATAHGLTVWFDSELADGISFSNAPGLPETIYSRAFFPFAEPLSLAQGDTVQVKLAANLVGDDYIWQWDTQVKDAEGKIKANHQQSTFWGMPLSMKQLRKKQADYTPSLNDEGRIIQMVLNSMTSEISLKEIAQQLTKQFPTHFPNWQAALTKAGELAQKYG